MNTALMEAAQEAISYLASRCDYARTFDGEGFSGVDAGFGHALSGKAERNKFWSDEEYVGSLYLIRKYRGQLERASHDLSQLLADLRRIEAEEAEAAAKNKPRRSRSRKVVQGSVALDPGVTGKAQIVICTNYHDEILQACRDMIGARWNSAAKQWEVTACRENARAAEALAERFGLQTYYDDQHWRNLPSGVSVDIVDNTLLLTGFPRLPERDMAFEYRGVKDEKHILSAELTSWGIERVLEWSAKHAVSFPQLRHDALSSLLDRHYLAALEAEKANAQRAASLALPSAEQEEIARKLPARLASALFPHQWSGIERILTLRQVVLADEQGLGKTLQALAALEAAKAYPAVVVAPAIARFGWRNEIATWMPHRKVHVAGGRVGKKDKGVDIADADIVVVNYESFRGIREELAEMRPRALILDEAQYLKTHNSARTEAIVGLLRQSESDAEWELDLRVLMSGTPVLNRPSEALTLMTMTPRILSALGGFWYVAKRYCEAKEVDNSWNGGTYWDFSGAAHLQELAGRLRSVGFIRREKATVLPDLPPKKINYEHVDITNRAEYDHANSEFFEWLRLKKESSHSRTQKGRGEKQDDDGDATWQEEMGLRSLDADARAEAIRKIGALRVLTGQGKNEAAVDWIERFLSENVKGEKLVVFAYFTETQAALKKRFPAALSITGEQSASARQNAIDKFVKDEKQQHRLIICSLKASQTAITLTSARHAMFVELDWTPAALEQAEDRIHRISQSRQVMITYLVARNTLDDRMLALLAHKRDIIKKITVTAHFGYRKDGRPRMQSPGPGRPALPPAERMRRRKSSNAGWQSRNLEYMREYMRQRRAELKKSGESTGAVKG